jgi:hypothetical protein
MMHNQRLHRIVKNIMNIRYLIFLLIFPLLCGAATPMERPGNWAQPFISATIGNL